MDSVKLESSLHIHFDLPVEMPSAESCTRGRTGGRTGATHRYGARCSVNLN